MNVSSMISFFAGSAWRRLLAVAAAAAILAQVAGGGTAGAQTSQPPERPTGLEAISASYSSVPLYWDDPGDATIESYQVLRRFPRRVRIRGRSRRPRIRRDRRRHRLRGHHLHRHVGHARHTVRLPDQGPQRPGSERDLQLRQCRDPHAHDHDQRHSGGRRAARGDAERSRR